MNKPCIIDTALLYYAAPCANLYERMTPELGRCE